MNNLCFLNGKIIPLAEATVSVLDRGFLFGDGVYEVVPTYHRQLFCWQRHLRRLAHNLTTVGINANVEKLTAAAKQLIEQSSPPVALYIQITRGVAAQRRHVFPSPPVSPTQFMMPVAVSPITDDKRQQGVSCHTMEEFRWRQADIKSTSLLAAVLIAQQALEKGDEEVILIRDGLLGEAAACNVFIVKSGILITPLADNRILPGISREIVLELATQVNIAVEERDIGEAELATADEIWLTSSTREVLPVTLLNGTKVGDGKPGTMYTILYNAFQRFIANGNI